MEEENVYDLARRLASALKASQQYRRYKATRKKVAEDEKNLQLIEQFHQKQLQYQQQQLSGKDLTEEQREELSRLQDLLQLRPEVREFLQAEVQLARMVADVQKIISDALDIGMAPAAQPDEPAGPTGEDLIDTEQ